VDVVFLHEIATLADALQDVRNERHPIAFGNLPERRLELLRVTRPVVRRDPYADEKNAGPACLRPPDNAREIVLHLSGRKPAQAVIAAKRHHDNFRPRARQELRDPGGSAARCFTRNTGIHDVIIEPFLPQTLF
jgi:hypothetical protein